MLPSLGFQEIVLLAVLALVVIGPKDLPLMLRKLGRWTARLRGMAQEFRTGFDELARQAELDELKREVEALRRTTNLNSLANEITKPLPTLEDYAGVKKSPSSHAEEGLGEEGRSTTQAPDQVNAPHPPAPSPQGGGGEDEIRHDEPVARSAP
jgi:sec-independent protein translocase protein TatB